MVMNLRICTFSNLRINLCHPFPILFEPVKKIFPNIFICKEYSKGTFIVQSEFGLIN